MQGEAMQVEVQGGEAKISEVTKGSGPRWWELVDQRSSGLKPSSKRHFTEPQLQRSRGFH
jgi:hypothetical protein